MIKQILLAAILLNIVLSAGTSVDILKGRQGYELLKKVIKNINII